MPGERGTCPHHLHGKNKGIEGGVLVGGYLTIAPMDILVRRLIMAGIAQGVQFGSNFVSGNCVCFDEYQTCTPLFY